MVEPSEDQKSKINAKMFSLVQSVHRGSYTKGNNLMKLFQSAQFEPPSLL